MEQPRHQTEIYKKAMEIQTLVDSLIELVKHSDLPRADDFDLDLVSEKLSEMQENAFEIPILISEASEASMPYDFRMENAVFVKSYALELIEGALYIEEMGLKDIDYLDLLYDEVESLRLLFVDWIKSFDLWKYEGDNWGLFSPEGIKLIEYIPEEDEDDEDFDDDDDDDDDDFGN